MWSQRSVYISCRYEQRDGGRCKDDFTFGTWESAAVVLPDESVVRWFEWLLRHLQAQRSHGRASGGGRGHGGGLGDGDGSAAVGGGSDGSGGGSGWGYFGGSKTCGAVRMGRGEGCGCVVEGGSACFDDSSRVHLDYIDAMSAAPRPRTTAAPRHPTCPTDPPPAAAGSVAAAVRH